MENSKVVDIVEDTSRFIKFDSETGIVTKDSEVGERNIFDVANIYLYSLNLYSAYNSITIIYSETCDAFKIFGKGGNIEIESVDLVNFAISL